MTIESKTTKQRKVIQLGGYRSFLFALCDDGKMFFSIPNYEEWLELENVPQPKWRKK